MHANINYQRTRAKGSHEYVCTINILGFTIQCGMHNLGWCFCDTPRVLHSVLDYYTKIIHVSTMVVNNARSTCTRGLQYLLCVCLFQVCCSQITVFTVIS